MTGRDMEVSRGLLKGLLDVHDPCKDEISSSGDRHGDLSGEPRKSVTDAGCPAVPEPDAVASIGLHGWSNVPAIFSMWGPSGPFCWLDMSQDPNPWRCNVV